MPRKADLPVPGRTAAAPGQAAEATAAAAAGPRLTARGAAVALFLLCFLGILAARWLGQDLLAGASFAVAAVLTAACTKRSDLLQVVVSPPAVFTLAVICAKAVTPQGSLLLSTAEGTLLTLAETAPWLIGGMAVCVIIALARGLRANARALSADLRADPSRRGGPARAAGTGRAA